MDGCRNTPGQHLVKSCIFCPIVINVTFAIVKEVGTGAFKVQNLVQVFGLFMVFQPALATLCTNEVDIWHE